MTPSYREGVLGMNINGTEGVIEAGSPAAAEPVCIAPGVVHYYWNARNDTALRIDVTLQPPGNSIDFFRTLIGAPSDRRPLIAGSRTTRGQFRAEQLTAQG
jgi:hypothetical protein